MTALITTIKGCARCSGEHARLGFKKLSRRVDTSYGGYDFWAPCPTNGEPILLKVTAASENQLAEVTP